MYFDKMSKGLLWIKKIKDEEGEGIEGSGLVKKLEMMVEIEEEGREIEDKEDSIVEEEKGLIEKG